MSETKQYKYTATGTNDDKPAEGTINATSEADALKRLKQIYGEGLVHIVVGKSEHNTLPQKDE